VKNALNETQYQALLQLNGKDSPIDFWSDPSRLRPTDIMVPPNELDRTEDYLRSFGINFDVAIPDVQGYL
jgi:hypothetical protein